MRALLLKLTKTQLPGADVVGTTNHGHLILQKVQRTNCKSLLSGGKFGHEPDKRAKRKLGDETT